MREMPPPHKRNHCFTVWFSKLGLGYNSFDAHLHLLSLPSGKTNALQDYTESEMRDGRDFCLSDCCSTPGDQPTISEDKMEVLFIILNTCIINIYLIADGLFTNIF